MDFILTLITALMFLFATAMTLIFNMHMFQLNSYKPKVHIKWLIDNKIHLIPQALLIIGGILALSVNSYTAMGVLFILLALEAVTNKPRKAKKPLVYTNRVIRMFVTLGILYGASTILSLTVFSFKTALAVFAFSSAISPLAVLLANLINKPIELSINKHYINDAKRILQSCPNLNVIGITGSYGKTSVKFYLNTLLRAKYNVLMTPESYNTPLGVVKTIRGSLKATHEIFLCEMGAKNVGDIKEICDIVHPKNGVITSVGPQHLESFKTLDNVKKTKFELADALPEKGMLFLNGDDANIREFSKDYTKPCTGITYGIEDNSEYSAYNLKLSERGTTFNVKTKDGETGEFTTKLIGRHNVLNIVGAIAVSHKLGISLKDLKPQVRKLENVPHRLQLLDRGENIIIDDAYNSNPNGTRVAMETLGLFDGMKILVTPGMVELGDKQDEYNFQFGQNASAVCDFVALVGKKQTESIYNGLIDKGYSPEKIFVADELMEAMAKVNSLPSEGRKKVILLENDLPDNY